MNSIRLRDEKIIKVTPLRRYFFFTRVKFDTNNGLFKENLVKYKGKRTSREYTFILFLILRIVQQKTPFKNRTAKNQGFHCAVGSAKEVGKRLCAVH